MRSIAFPVQCYYCPWFVSGLYQERFCFWFNFTLAYKHTHHMPSHLLHKYYHCNCNYSCNNNNSFTSH